MRTVAIIQARMGSSRLPGKVLKPLGTQSALAHVISRVQACPLVHEVVVATTTRPDDGAIVDVAEQLGVSSYRGSEHDVLERYYHASRDRAAQLVVRVTSDCPLFDPTVLTGLLERFMSLQAAGTRVDYISSALERTFPRGLDAEAFTFAALEQAYAQAEKPYEREHVTPFLYQNTDRFAVHNYANDRDLSYLRWTLDTEEDYRFLQAIFDELSSDQGPITTRAVLDLLDRRPDLLTLNAHVEQKKLGE